MLPYTGVSAKEAAPDQNSTSAGNNQLLGAGKPVATTIIKRCPTVASSSFGQTAVMDAPKTSCLRTSIARCVRTWRMRLLPIRGPAT